MKRLVYYVFALFCGSILIEGCRAPRKLEQVQDTIRIESSSIGVDKTTTQKNTTILIQKVDSNTTKIIIDQLINEEGKHEKHEKKDSTTNKKINQVNSLEPVLAKLQNKAKKDSMKNERKVNKVNKKAQVKLAKEMTKQDKFLLVQQIITFIINVLVIFVVLRMAKNKGKF